MNKAEELLERWDDLNAEIEEFTCISNILDYATHVGESENVVQLNLGGAIAFINRHVNDMSRRYTVLLDEIKPLLKA